MLYIPRWVSFADRSRLETWVIDNFDSLHYEWVSVEGNYWAFRGNPFGSGVPAPPDLSINYSCAVTLETSPTTVDTVTRASWKRNVISDSWEWRVSSTDEWAHENLVQTVKDIYKKGIAF